MRVRRAIVLSIPTDGTGWITLRPGGKATQPVSRTRKVGAPGLLALGGILVVTAIVAGVLRTEREAHFVRLESRLRDLEHRLGQELAVTPRPPAGSR